jgi:hypothetical protein
VSYRIDYFKHGQSKGSTPWGGTLDDTRKVAVAGLVRRRADIATIFDTKSGAEVASVKRSARKSFHS